jgi:hypothetical protein
MDLPLATPELDHDALIFNPLLWLNDSRDEGYSPPPAGSWQWFTQYQAMRTNLIYQLVS